MWDRWQKGESLGKHKKTRAMAGLRITQYCIPTTPIFFGAVTYFPFLDLGHRELNLIGAGLNIFSCRFEVFYDYE